MEQLCPLDILDRLGRGLLMGKHIDNFLPATVEVGIDISIFAWQEEN
jgi:hypothetical protein